MPVVVPAGRVDAPGVRIFHPRATVQCDLWLPEPGIPVTDGVAMMLPVLVMTALFPKFITAVVIPSRRPRAGHVDREGPLAAIAAERPHDEQLGSSPAWIPSSSLRSPLALALK
jgi:hypothetical protein